MLCKLASKKKPMNLISTVILILKAREIIFTVHEDLFIFAKTVSPLM